MAKTTRGGARSDTLAFGAISLWVLVMLCAGGMVVAAASGWIDLSELPPLPQVPTVPAMPPAPTRAETSFILPATDIPVIATPLPTLTPRPTGDGLFFEPTFTPSVIFTPTPFIFIPQPTFSEGPIIIGYSLGGRPLEVYRFGNGPVKRMIVAGIHGGYEANTVALADELIAHIQSNPDFIPRNVTLYILRNLNPDGYARAKGVDGRANNNNVDLNRNFPVNWQREWSRSGCWSYRTLNGGSGPGSEPETQALIAFVSQIRPTALISYHSAALGIFPGGEPADPDSIVLAETLADVSKYPYPPIDTGCFYTGSLPDWAVSEGIAAVDLELHTHKYTDFDENLILLTAFMLWRR
ncbi:MAG: succinylglutamate desuccinylase/aspartoacylase family protein [Anaerolineales bacterium]|nr:succinylglutamate desuccinylase/aspartoacylase family protein [Anaerolineales bacterium]